VIVGAAINPVTSVVDFRAQPGVASTTPPVPTDLPADQAVNSAANIPPARNDARKTDKTPPGNSRSVIIDTQTNSVVFRSLDAHTGAVIDQVPARALLRQRAYVDAQAVQALIQGKDLTTAALAAAQEIDATA
jgi:hypothetical protein